MAGPSKKPKKPLGFVFEVFVLALAVAATAAFIPAYGYWTEDRDYGVAEMECLEKLDSDCFLRTYNETDSKYRTPGAFPEGRWMWTLRFMKTSGSLDARLEELMRQPDNNMTPYFGNSLYEFETDKLLGVHLSLLSFGESDAAKKFVDSVIAKHRELAKGPKAYNSERRYYEPGYALSGCASGERKEKMLDPDFHEWENTLLTEDPRSACWFIYYQNKDEETVRQYVQANLEAIREQWLKYGTVYLEGELIRKQEISYMDTMAFLAALLEFRKNPDTRFGIK